jgi:predicted GIY-YIG superfamily endonuclease
MSQWYCYMLVSGKKTYIGATVNPARRLRQHNGELRGGARATSGHTWKRQFLLGGFPDDCSALRFEWRWKFLSRQAPGDTWIERRTHALSLLLSDFPYVTVLEDGEDNKVPDC